MNANSNDKKKSTVSTLWKGPPPRTEAELLEIQACTAKDALAKLAKSAASNLARLVDPRAWAEDYPLKSTGIAAVVGFAIGTKGGAESEKKISQEVPPVGPPSPSPWDTLTSTLIGAGTDALKGAITPWLAQKIGQVLQDNDPTPEAPVPNENPSASEG